MGINIRGLQLGYMGLDKEFLLFPHPDYILTSQRREAPHVWYPCPALSYIIDTPDGKILWETGISSNWEEEWPAEWQYLIDMTGITPEVCLENRLKQVGLGPDDFRYVILGHLHCDHAGGLRLFQDAGAEILVHQNEWGFAETLDAPNYFFSPADFAVLKNKKPSLISGDEQLMKDVQLIELPGHSPGTMGLLLRLEHTGHVLLTSDAMYMHESYGPPAVGSAVTMDVGKWASSSEKIHRLAHEHEALLFPGHDETGVKQNKDNSEFRQIEFWPDYVYE